MSARRVVLLLALLALTLLVACGEELRDRPVKQTPDQGGLTPDGN